MCSKKNSVSSQYIVECEPFQSPIPTAVVELHEGCIPSNEIQLRRIGMARMYWLRRWGAYANWG